MRAGSACVGNGFSGWLQQTFGKGSSASSESTEAAAPDAGAASKTPAESADSSLPTYNANPLTGEPRRSDGRIVGVMVNNISNTQNRTPARSAASARLTLLIESKVEGGITRFCALYLGRHAIPEIAAALLAATSFCSCSCRWQTLYYHDGESTPCTQFISVYDYSGPEHRRHELLLHAPTHPHVAHRDNRGSNVAYEHNEFDLRATEIQTGRRQRGHRSGLPVRSDLLPLCGLPDQGGQRPKMSGAAAAKTIDIIHSAAT